MTDESKPIEFVNIQARLQKMLEGGRPFNSKELSFITGIDEGLVLENLRRMHAMQQVSFNEATVRIGRDSITKPVTIDEEGLRVGTIKHKAYEVLMMAGKPMTSRDVAYECGIVKDAQINSMSTVLTGLVKAGKIARIGRGIYAPLGMTKIELGLKRPVTATEIDET